MRKIKFINGEYYHLFNRGVDKRDIFLEQKDLERFFQSMFEFNVLAPIGSIYAASFHRNNPLRNLVSKSEKLVDFICYCLCPNHYHFILRQLIERGIEKFMHRLGLGYTNYFNKKYKRSGSLFQGPFKASHINSNEYLLYVSAYVGLNYQVHELKDELFKSSWEDYFRSGGKEKFCNPDIVLNQFASASEYNSFAKNAVIMARERKDLESILKLDLGT